MEKKFTSDTKIELNKLIKSMANNLSEIVDRYRAHKFPETTFSVKRVIHLKVIDDLKMMLYFDGDNQARIVDFSKIILSHPSLMALKDPSILKKAKIFGSALRWEDQDIDLEAADLYDDGETMNAAPPIIKLDVLGNFALIIKFEGLPPKKWT
jgi:hypothetical protein